MSQDTLQQVRDLQREDKGGAEALLLSFIQDNFPELDVASLALTPLAVSLNSFNGFLTLRDGRRRFFKSHTESDTVIDEYYNAEMLANAGYPVIQPIFKSTEPGKQFLVYEVIDDQSVFDAAWEIETGQHDDLGALTQAQHRADDDLLRLYLETLEPQNAEDAAKAPIHQLFHHRLTRGRLDRFYASDKSVMLSGRIWKWDAVKKVKWIINGQAYNASLDNSIERAIQLLQPSQAASSIIGHGDAHNGNVFFRKSDNPPSLLYFDPAFAGRHHPLLDLAKPIFHNVFAMWMYFPQQKQAITSVTLQVDDDTWHIEHAYDLPEVRQMFLRSKVDRVMIPLLQHLKSKHQLREDWRAYFKAALFCCPFLTMNLLDRERFPLEITLLGLAMSVEMGGESQGTRSLIDRTLDEVEAAL